ncbi:MAG TPA: hypothetical protein VM571_03495, partial [Noviherbaspirillum sp.]|nr:hypothetical protein [Noviherbaspirillum sp.]
MQASKSLLILGFGGHARSVADVALAAGFSSLLFVDSKVHDDEHFLGHPAQRSFSGALPQGWSCLPAAGNNQLRRMQIAAIKT